MSAPVIDAFEFCRLKERLEGETPVAELPRLAAECVDPNTSLRWSLEGGMDTFGHPRLRMGVAGTVQLTCQRCMTPFAFPIRSESVLVLAKSEAQADEIEELIADDAVDVIVGSRTANVLEWIEDEALLALPLSPRHEICPDGRAVGDRGDDGKPSPFDVLKGIGRKKE